jgi:hypothetical protein
MHPTAKECAETLIAIYGKIKGLQEAKNLERMYSRQDNAYWSDYYKEVAGIINSLP